MGVPETDWAPFYSGQVEAFLMPILFRQTVLLNEHAVLARLHQLRGLGDAKVLKSLGHSPKGRHYRG